MIDPSARLPCLLPPSAYHDPEHHARELARIFVPGWHCVATRDDVPAHGDFVTCDLLGKPLIVRNERGLVRAFLNVCAHRHTLLTHAPCGNAPRMRCQYHGWEYDGDGAVCKIPDAACFTPVRRGGERLVAYRTETLGALVFVTLDDHAPALTEHLGPRVTATIERLFGRGQRQGVARTMEHPCNWKIPLENVLESYHVPMLHQNVIARHPRVFRLFQGTPAAPRHELDARYTVVHDALGADSRLYRGVLRRLRPDASTAFEHVHAFPSMLLGETAVLSFLQVVLPVTATTSRSMVRMFLDVGQRDRPIGERAFARVADRVAEALFVGLMREDTPVFPDVQRGMAASEQRGVLGSMEARLHAFHDYVASACAD